MVLRGFFYLTRLTTTYIYYKCYYNLLGKPHFIEVGFTFMY